MGAAAMAQALAVVCSAFVRKDERGTFVEILNRGPWETVITGSMRAGGVLGNHYHKKTRLFLYLLEGAAEVFVQDVSREGDRRDGELAAVVRGTLLGGQGVYLEPNHAHAIRFLEESTFLLLKSRRYSEDDADTFAYEVINSAKAD